MTLDSVHDQPLYLVCPDMFRAVGVTSDGIRVGFIRSTHSLHYLFVYLCCKVYSYPVTQTKNHILTTEKKSTVASLQK
jgi:hypothetical protein